MKIRFKLIALIIILSVFSGHASPVKFYNINSMFGISMRETNSVCKDIYGFIWVSSKTGILRLTDENYRQYNLPYETSDVMNVRLIYQYSKLYAYTNNGQFFLYNPICDRFDLIINLSRALNNKHLGIYNLCIDESGAYWIATSIGLYKYESGNLSFIDIISQNRYSMTWFNRSNLILGCQGGIWILDTHSLKKELIYENRSMGPMSISKLYYNKSQDKLLIGTISSGLFCYDFKSETFTGLLTSIFPKQPIFAIEKNSDSTYLVGVDGQGIWEINLRGDRVNNVYKEDADDPTSLHGNGIYDLYCDEEKRVWICTYSGGLSYFDQASPLVSQVVHHTNNINSLINNDVNSIIEDQWGKLWFATNNGISRWDPASNRWENFYHNKQTQAQVFLTLCEDTQGKIWAGSYSSGVYILDGKTGKELAHYSQKNEAPPKVSDFIIKIFKDKHGDIWLGGASGEITCYLSGENKFRSYPNEPVSSFAELSDNQLLLGCSYGLSMLNKETGEIKKLLLGLLVHDILLVDNFVWICTSGDGLVRFNYKNNDIEKFNLQSGLPSNFISSIAYTDGFLWLGTENGLCRLNPIDKSVTTYSSVRTLSHTSYNRRSFYKLKNGSLAWGTNNGVLIFAPNSINEIPSNGKIFLNDLTISGRSIRDIPSFKLDVPVDNLEDINLKYYQNTISLELLSIGTSSDSKFSWMMEGFDKEWSPPTNNRIITYTNLPSGHFILKIQLFENSLMDIIGERKITLNVIPPFWRKIWFIIAVFLVISGIIFLILLYYINSLKQKHTEEKIRFFTNIAHDIRTSLTLIKAPVDELIHEKNLSESGRHYLHIAIEQGRRLTSVVTKLMDFQKVDIGKDKLSLLMVDIVNLILACKLLYESFARGRNIEIEFITDRQNYLAAIDEAKIEKVIDNLISNAVKYSNPRGKVLIDLKCENDKWLLKVIDHGIGISKKAQRKLFKEFYRGENAMNSKIVGSGIGLLLVKNYITMHGGSISCESQENLGSTFLVSIPYKEVAEVAKPVNTLTETEATSLPTIDIAQQIGTDYGNDSSKRMSVLIVEDNDDLRNFMLSSIGGEFKMFSAEDGVQAWEFISKHLPDLVVSDVLMPNMDGFELCKLMKSTYETAHIPIILLTALSQKAEQLYGLGLGADDYLNKPFDMYLLVQKIKTIILNREVVREKALKLIKEVTTEPILTNELNDKFVRKMLEVAWANISNSEFDKEGFASAMNVSSSLLYKKIKSLTGQSPTDFIKTVRLRHAFELLQTRQYTITEVSELCGFSSLSYFSTVFKKFFGKSPTDLLE